MTWFLAASCVLAGERRALLGDRAGAVDVVDDVELVAGAGQLVQAADDDRRRSGRPPGSARRGR